jgi:hypothetical protein
MFLIFFSEFSKGGPYNFSKNNFNKKGFPKMIYNSLSMVIVSITNTGGF